MSIVSIRERLATFCHQQWANWMEHLFSKCIQCDEGYLIPQAYVDNLQKLMDTNYPDLSNEQKENDRREADKILKLL